MRNNVASTMSIDESSERLAHRIAAASVKHMSDTKWRELFVALHALPKRPAGVSLKFVGDDRLFDVPLPGPVFECDDNFGECGGISYAKFAHIEFLQIPESSESYPNGPKYSTTQHSNDLECLEKQLASARKYPITRYEAGIRIVGYEWTE